MRPSIVALGVLGVAVAFGVGLAIGHLSGDDGQPQPAPVTRLGAAPVLNVPGLRHLGALPALRHATTTAPRSGATSPPSTVTPSAPTAPPVSATPVTPAKPKAPSFTIVGGSG